MPFSLKPWPVIYNVTVFAKIVLNKTSAEIQLTAYNNYNINATLQYYLDTYGYIVDQICFHVYTSGFLLIKSTMKLHYSALRCLPGHRSQGGSEKPPSQKRSTIL